MNADTHSITRWRRAAAAALATALLLSLGGCDSGSSAGTPRGPNAPVGSVGAPRVQQARWQLKTFPAGNAGKVTKKEARGVSDQRPRLTSIVRRLYNALFLAPERTDALVKEVFTKAAGARFIELRPGIGRASRDVKILRRSARIGIDVSGARRAAARVRLVAQGRLRDGRFAVEHTGDLFLQLQHRRWRVIAFDIHQRPFHKKPKRDHKERDDRKRGGRDGSKKHRGRRR